MNPVYPDTNQFVQIDCHCKSKVAPEYNSKSFKRFKSFPLKYSSIEQYNKMPQIYEEQQIQVQYRVLFVLLQRILLPTKQQHPDCEKWAKQKENSC